MYNTCCVLCIRLLKSKAITRDNVFLPQVTSQRFKYTGNNPVSSDAVSKNDYPSDINISPTVAFFDAFATLLGQDFLINKPKFSSFRILMGTWYVFAIIFTTGYKSKLIAFMMMPKIPPLINTLTEIVESGYRLEPFHTPAS